MRNLLTAIAASVLIAAGSAAALAQTAYWSDPTSIPGVKAVDPEAGRIFFDNGDQYRLPGRIVSIEPMGANQVLVSFQYDETAIVKHAVIDLRPYR